jgi:transposase-like protein
MPRAKKQLGLRKHDAAFKAKVALEALRGQMTANEITSVYGVHGTQIARWKKIALEGLPGIFSDGSTALVQSSEALTAPLYQQIGQLKVELDWLKKKSELLG